MAVNYSKELITSLNNDINTYFPLISPIEEGFKTTHEGVSRLVMLDRYSQKDKNQISIKEGDLVVCIVKEDPVFPSRGLGYIHSIDRTKNKVVIKLEEELVETEWTSNVKVMGKLQLAYTVSRLRLVISQILVFP